MFACPVGRKGSYFCLVPGHRCLRLVTTPPPSSLASLSPPHGASLTWLLVSTGNGATLPHRPQEGGSAGKANSSLGGLCQAWALVALSCSRQRLGCSGQPSIPGGMTRAGGNCKTGETTETQMLTMTASRRSRDRVPVPATLVASFPLPGICPFSSSPVRAVEPAASLARSSVLYTLF